MEYISARLPNRARRSRRLVFSRIECRWRWKHCYQVQGGVPRLFYIGGLTLCDLSVFVDESGTQEGATEYYVVTCVLHDQSDDIYGTIAGYEQSLRDKGLPDIPFHATPLLRAHDEYSNLDIEDRKGLLVAFSLLVKRLPIRYRTFVYRSREFGDARRLQALIRRDLVAMLVDHLDYFQSFDHVKIYYDHGQTTVTSALTDAFEYALAKDAAIPREPDYHGFRLSQVADYLCAIELTAQKYADRRETSTDERFFGGSQAFRRNWLKQARRKRLE